MAEGTQGLATLVGQVIGGYRLERVLGKGATGAVFLGRWAAAGPRPRVERVGDVPIELPEQAAVKVLILPWQLDGAERNDFRARFQREAETQQRVLRHPHVVTVLAYGEDAASGLTYMVQPYLPGGTLAERMAARTAPTAFSEAVATVRQLADGLDYAHGRGVIHRDIKPGNVLLDERGAAYLTDFSIVRLLEDTHTKLTATGQVLGTPQYMAPEQVAGGVVGPEADLYSLGMVAYELVTGRPAFEGASYADLVRRVTLETPPAPRSLRPDLPTAAEDVLLKALARRPTDRFATATAFAEAFAHGIQGQPAAGVARMAAPGITPGNAPGITPVASGMGQATPIRSSIAYTPYAPPAVPHEAQTVPVYAPPSPTSSQYGAGYGAGAQWPLGAPGAAQPRRSGGPWAVAVALVLLAVVGAVIGEQVLSRASAHTTGTATATTQSALVPAGALIYSTGSPGQCDGGGATWRQNTQVSSTTTQACANGGLVLSQPEANASIGIVALTSLPSGDAFPNDYVAQVTVESISSVPTAKLGLKFRQQSPDDSGEARGGYSFLLDPNGQFQFNRYYPDGTRHTVNQKQLGPFPNGHSHTLDLVVKGTSFALSLDGTLLDSEQDATYSAGFFCLAIEPGATVVFSHLALYQSPQ